MLISCPLLCLLWEKCLWKGEVLLPQYALIKLLLSRGKGGGKKVSVSIAWKGRGEKVSISIAWNKPYLQKQFLPPLCTGMGFLRATAPLLYCVASTLLIGPQIKEKEEGIKVRVLFILEEGFIPCAILPLAVWVQIKAVTRVYMHRFRCWPSEFRSGGDHLPGEQQASRRAGS